MWSGGAEVAGGAVVHQVVGVNALHVRAGGLEPVLQHHMKDCQCLDAAGYHLRGHECQGAARRLASLDCGALTGWSGHASLTQATFVGCEQAASQ